MEQPIAPTSAASASASAAPTKTQEDLLDLSRSPVVNKALELKEAVKRKKPRYTMWGLVEENKLTWGLKNLSHLFGGRFKPYPSYANTPEDSGVYPLHTNNPSGEISITLLADWATDTQESQDIADLGGTQDYSIHLGDTYYVGSAAEIADNFDDDNGGAWKYGKIGSFALLGNHEMYSGGDAYFKDLLPFMGLYYDRVEMPQVKQKASFFCLKNEFWKIVGLDTGYDSLGGFFNTTPNKNLKLHDLQIEWLKKVVFADPNDKQGVIILSHHQPFSAFEAEFQNPLRSIDSLIGAGRQVLWICGHEHRMAVYGRNELDGGGNGYFARCIGHGGMPVEFMEPGNAVGRKLVIYDRRERQKVNEVPVGHNGFAILRLKGPSLVVDYYDDSKDPAANAVGDDVTAKRLLSEEWKIDNATGELKGVGIVDLSKPDPAGAAIVDLSKQLTQVLPGLNSAIGL